MLIANSIKGRLKIHFSFIYSYLDLVYKYTQNKVEYMGMASSKPCYPDLSVNCFRTVFTPSSNQKIYKKSEGCTHYVTTSNFDSLTIKLIFIWLVSHIYSTFCSTCCFIEYNPNKKEYSKL